MLGICLVEATKRTGRDGGLGSCWWTVVFLWQSFEVTTWKSVGDRLTGKVESDVLVARAGL